MIPPALPLLFPARTPSLPTLSETRAGEDAILALPPLLLPYRELHASSMRHVSASHHLLHHYSPNPKPSRLPLSSLPRHSHSGRSDFLDSSDQLLRRCARVQQCEQVHAQFVITGRTDSGFLASGLVSAYARFGGLSIAQKVFDSFTQLDRFSNQVLWNSIIRANVSAEWYDKALNLYGKMRECGNLGDGFTFPLVIRACRNVGCDGGRRSRLGEIVHCHVVEMGFQSNLHIANELVGMYGRLGRMVDARKVFDRMPVRTTLSWNMMVSGYSFNCDSAASLGIFQRMESEGLEPNLVTWTSLLSSHARSGLSVETMNLFRSMRIKGVGVNAEALAVILSVCADLDAFDTGKAIHCHVVKDGFEDYLFVKHSLISLYGKSGDVAEAQALFEKIANKNIVSWNALITCYADAGLCDEAFVVFSQVERPDVVSWSAVISAFAANERAEEALSLFRKMQTCSSVTANAVTLCSVLSACAELSALNLGKEVHGYAIRTLPSNDLLVSNSLIDMYTKCGNLQQGHVVFERTQDKDVVSWNSIIKGLGMHGHGVEALQMFDRMITSGHRPDGVTFVAILSACSHAGLVDQGRSLFHHMVSEYQIEPTMEHYACAVDMLGRSGLLEEAGQVVKNMPMEPNDCVLGALLNSCRIHKNATFAGNVAPCSAWSYTLMSNIYSGSGNWEDAARERVSARRKGLKKAVGQSWIEVEKEFCKFAAGGCLEEKVSGEVFRVLEGLKIQMEGLGDEDEGDVIFEKSMKLV